MQIFITLQDIISMILIGAAIIGCIVYAIFKTIVNIHNRTFKKNCYDCKYYKLHNVAGFGDQCQYKCTKYNRVDNGVSMNEREHYEKCKEFESENGGAD